PGRRRRCGTRSCPPGRRASCGRGGRATRSCRPARWPRRAAPGPGLRGRPAPRRGGGRRTECAPRPSAQPARPTNGAVVSGTFRRGTIRGILPRRTTVPGIFVLAFVGKAIALIVIILILAVIGFFTLV